MITYLLFFITFLRLFSKKKNFQIFKEKLEKKVTKMRHVIIPIQPDLPGLRFMKELFTMAIVAKELWSLIVRFFLNVIFCLFQNTDVI